MNGTGPIEQEIINAIRQYRFANKVAEVLGYPYSKVLRIAKKNGLKLGNQKATIEQYLASYEKTKSVWKTAEELGVCGQTVWEALKKHGVSNPPHLFSCEEENELKAMYESGILKGDGKIKAFCEKYNRTRQFVSRKARQLGLTRMSRRHSGELVQRDKRNRRGWWETHIHPRGMLGKKHTPEFKEAMGRKTREIWATFSDAKKKAINTKRMEHRLKNKGSIVANLGRMNWKSGYRKIGRRILFFRSSWEANYARYLQLLKNRGQIREWKHEVRTYFFRKEGVAYLPDFKVYFPDHWELHEVKGWFDERSKRNLALMKEYYPLIKIVVIAKPEYKKIQSEFASQILDWEFSAKDSKKQILINYKPNQSKERN